MAGHRSILSWYLEAKTAFSVHSPQIFRFCEEVLDDSRWYYAFDMIEAAHQELGKDDQTTLKGTQAKRDPQIIPKPLRSLFSYFCKSQQERKGQKVFRICKWWQPDIIIEFGCSDGRSSAYLTAGRSSASLFVIAADKTKLNEASALWGELGITHIVPVYASPQKAWSFLPNLDKKRALIYIGEDYDAEGVQLKLQEFSEQFPKPHLIVIDAMTGSGEKVAEWRSFALNTGGAWLDLYDNYLWIADKAFLQPLPLTLISRKYKPFRMGWI